MRQKASKTNKQSKDNKTEIQAQAGFEMLKGESMKSVSEKFGICRNKLYQLRKRAINAVRREIENPAKRKTPAHNRLPTDKENKAVRLCELHPTLSSYRISRKLRQLEMKPSVQKNIKTDG
jgi:hypothetical protein